jgi:transposase
MRSREQLQQDKDEIIWDLWYNVGYSKKKIAQVAHCGEARVRQVIDNHKLKQGLPLEHHVGRPVRITEEVKSRVLQMARENSRLSDQALAEKVTADTGLKIGKSTVNAIRHGAHFFYAPAKKCPYLSPDQIYERLQFIEDWKGPMYDRIRREGLTVIVTDESRICNEPDSRMAWRQRGCYTFTMMDPRNKYARISIMVWGAVGKGFKSKLVFIKGNVNTDTYIQILQDFFKEADEKLGYRKWVFVQDGASCHTSQKAIDAICKRAS